MKQKNKKLVALLLILLPILLAAENITIPVKYFDMHSDGSNPEFTDPCPVEPGGSTVSFQLDSRGIPMPGDNPKVNQNILQWYDPWMASGNFLSTRYALDTVGEEPCYAASGEDIDVDHDTAFINDTLSGFIELTDLGNGTLAFEADSFFPLDNKGFGNEGEDHNYGFCMMLSIEAGYKRGMSLDFNSSDDGWVFLHRMVLCDFGGAHPKADSDTTVEVDSIFPNPLPDPTLWQIFFANRGSESSYLKFRLNGIGPLAVGIQKNPSIDLHNNGLAKNIRINNTFNGVEINALQLHIKSVSVVTPQGRTLYKSEFKNRCGRFAIPLEYQ